MNIDWGQLLIAGPLVFVAGFVDAVAGGGGLISLPAYYMAGLPPHTALGSNKMSSVVGTVVSTAQYAGSGYLRTQLIPMSIIFALIGSYAGARCTLFLSETFLKVLMMVLIPAIAVFTIAHKGFLTVSGKEPPLKKALLLTAVCAFAIGWYDGFFGPGAGIFYMLAFVGLIKLDVVTACGNTKVVNLASNLAALTAFIHSGHVLFSLALPCALFSVLGNFVGSRLTIKKGAAVVKPVMLAVIALLLFTVGRDLINAGFAFITI